MTEPINYDDPHKKLHEPYYDNPPVSEIDDEDVQQNIPVYDPNGFLV